MVIKLGPKGCLRNLDKRCQVKLGEGWPSYVSLGSAAPLSVAALNIEDSPEFKKMRKFIFGISEPLPNFFPLVP